MDVINDYRGYNIVKPFTKNVDQMMLGKIVEYLRNQNVTKEKDWVGLTELFPHMKGEIPEFMEHETVKEFRDAIKHFPMLHEEAIEEILGEMDTVIREEYGKGTESDIYVIRKLSKLRGENTPKQK